MGAIAVESGVMDGALESAGALSARWEMSIGANEIDTTYLHVGTQDPRFRLSFSRSGGGRRAYHHDMRKLLAMVLVLFGCLTFVGQAVASVSAGYSDCCLQGCKGMAQCANVSCQACAAPQPAPMADQAEMPAPDARHWRASPASFDGGPSHEPWTPPD